VNWYKVAEAAAVAVTSERLGAMDWRERRALAKNRNISQQTQQLFFTEKYPDRSQVLRYLAQNPNISQQIQQLFFTEEYLGRETGSSREHRKGDVLLALARNTNLSSQTQQLFFTEEYAYKGYALQDLAQNPNISQQIQPLFFTQEYERKNQILQYLAENPSFLRGDFTTAQWLQIKNAARGKMRLLILSKRLEQIQKVAADIIRGKLKGGL